MSAYGFSTSDDALFYVVANDSAVSVEYGNYSRGVRPVVSLKHGTLVMKGGDGTPTNPYVVKYE